MTVLVTIGEKMLTLVGAPDEAANLVNVLSRMETVEPISTAYHLDEYANAHPMRLGKRIKILLEQIEPEQIVSQQQADEIEKRGRIAQGEWLRKYREEQEAKTQAAQPKPPGQPSEL